MRFLFKELPGTPVDYLRPVIPVVVEGLPRAPQLCLVDSGALHNRFGSWVAEAGGIELEDAPAETIALGGFHTEARTKRVRLGVGDFAWEAPVSFCHPWPLAFHILGQEGFFRWFEVSIRAARFTIDLELEAE
ncbi:MAG: hypothetical protein ACRDJL_11215 [Actinomycetota bacterium]